MLLTQETMEVIRSLRTFFGWWLSVGLFLCMNSTSHVLECTWLPYIWR